MQNSHAQNMRLSRTCWPIQAQRSADYTVQSLEPLLSLDNPALLDGGPVPGRRFLVVDAGIPQELRDAVETYFDANRIERRTVLLPGGEDNKQLDTVLHLLQEFQDFGIERQNEPVVIVGGGAVLDVASLAASLYRRGVPFIRVPTTLLAYVDAAVGVKTGINFGGVKNLVGSFAAPQCVLLDRVFLQSLPDIEISCGLGEILKLALGCDVELFELLEDGAESFFAHRFMDDLGEVVLRRSVSAILAELEPNLFEANLARTLDMGHTFSLSFELPKQGPPLRHGEAVALDLNLSAVMALRRGLVGEGDVSRLATLTDRLGLPTRLNENADPAWTWESVIDRQRHRGGFQRIPVPSGIGSCGFIDDLTYVELVDAMNSIGPR